MIFDDLATNVVNARELYNATVAERDAARATSDANAQALADTRTQLTAAQTENLSLKGQLTQCQKALADCQGTTPPPPVTPKLLMGATVDQRNGQTRAQANADFESFAGPLMVRRAFLGGAPTTTNLAALLAEDYGKRHRIVSYKGEGSDTTLKTIKNDGFKTYMVKYHEPENDGGTHTAAWFRGVTDEEIAQVKRLGRPDLIPSFVLMSWLERDAASLGTSSADWFPTDKAGVVMLIDPYDPNMNKSMAQLAKPTIDLWRAQGGTRWGLSELGTHRTGAAGAAWINETLAFVKAEGGEVAAYFHSAVGAEGPWWMDDPAVRAAWKAEATKQAALV